MARPVAEFVSRCAIETGRVGERLPWGKLDMVAARGEIGFIAAVADVRARALHDLFAALADLPHFAGRDDQGGDAVNLFGVENAVDAVNEAAALLVVVGVLVAAAGLGFPEFNMTGLLALADHPALFGGLFERHPSAICVALPHGGNH